MNKYIDNIYLNSQVETRIGDITLKLFTEDVGDMEENLQGNYFTRRNIYSLPADLPFLTFGHVTYVFSCLKSS